MKRTMIGCAAAMLLASSSALGQGTQWDFNGDLSATFGSNFAQFFGDAALYAEFDTTTNFGISDIDGVEGNVMYIVPPFELNAIAVSIGETPNAGGIYVNEYTLIFDILVPQDAFDNYGWLSFYNTNDLNANDGDTFVRLSDGGIGIASVYHGQLLPDTWHRVVLTWTHDVDNGTMDFHKYIDGLLVGLQDDLSVPDGRWAMYSANDDDFDSDAEGFWLLADESGDESPAYISSFYFVDYPLTESEIYDLGGPNALGATTPGQEPNPPCEGDLDGDGDVDQSDLGILLANYECGT